MNYESDYSLLDSGDHRKLERFGEFVLSRPDPQAIWKKSLTDSVWDEAQASFTFESKWKSKKDLPKSWNVDMFGLKFDVFLSNFKHTGVFPEHIENWSWIEKQVESLKSKVKNNKPKILNLFGYTGGATLAAARAGAEVVHVDASKVAVSYAQRNADLSGLKDAPIRYIVDDAIVFLKREISRQEKGIGKYDGIVLDPPSFGRGNKGEVWKIEESLVSLLELSKKVLNPESHFVLLNGYAEGYSKESYAQVLSTAFSLPLDQVERGDLFIKESNNRSFSLHCGIFARFAK